MNKIEYYFFPPNEPQFYFPKENFKGCSSYYTPYSVKSKIFWYMFENSSLVRGFFTIPEQDIPLQTDRIKTLLNLKNSTLFYNLGTKGPEQKTTIIADNKKEKRFLKFAQKKRAIKLVNNEIKTLLELQENHKLNTAKVIAHESNNDFAYFITDVISGKKYNTTKLNDEVFNCLIKLAKTKPLLDAEIKETFSHGDFCPWNILRDSKTSKLVLIDWEMAAFKPLGYDLFTFMFQTNFLLNPKKSCNTIIEENLAYVNNYFNMFQIKNWHDYLTKFAKLKIVIEKDKETSLLFSKYNELLSYNGEK